MHVAKEIISNSRILVVDDVDLARAQARAVLKAAGFQRIEYADTGNLALDLVQTASLEHRDFDLILCDWNMPGMDGLEFLAHLRKNPSLRLIPFIMVTAEMNTQSIVKAITAGASDYIVKPFTQDSFTRKLRALNDRLLKVA